MAMWHYINKGERAISSRKVYQILSKAAKNRPDEVALLYTGIDDNEIVITYKEVWRKTLWVKDFFRKSAQKRTALIASNSPEWLFYAWGIIMSGNTCAVCDPQLALDDLISALDRTDLERVVIDSSLVKIAEVIRTSLPQIEILWMEKNITDEVDEKEFIADDSYEEGDYIFFTSGTSKNSKAAINPTSIILGGLDDQLELIVHEPGKKVLIPLPLHHAYGFVTANLFYYAGCPLFISSMRTLKQDIVKADPTTLLLVPSAVEFLLKKKAFSSSVKNILVSGAYFPPELAKKVSDLGIIVQNRYGSTEVPGGMGENLPGREISELTMHGFVRAEVVDGEVLIHTKYHIPEYYKNPEDTKEMIDGDTIHTGDMGYLDENGKLHLYGRRKNLLIMENGDKIMATDVDENLKALKGIEDAAVIYQNKKLIAVVSISEGVTLQEINNVVDEYNKTQPVGRRIREVWDYQTKLPYTSSGKLKRRDLDAEYLRRKECE